MKITWTCHPAVCNCMLWKFKERKKTYVSFYGYVSLVFKVDLEECTYVSKLNIIIFRPNLQYDPYTYMYFCMLCTFLKPNQNLSSINFYVFFCWRQDKILVTFLLYYCLCLCILRWFVYNETAKLVILFL